MITEILAEVVRWRIFVTLRVAGPSIWICSTSFNWIRRRAEKVEFNLRIDSGLHSDIRMYIQSRMSPLTEVRWERRLYRMFDFDIWCTRIYFIVSYFWAHFLLLLSDLKLSNTTRAQIISQKKYPASPVFVSSIHYVMLFELLPIY